MPITRSRSRASQELASSSTTASSSSPMTRSRTRQLTANAQTPNSSSSPLYISSSPDATTSAEESSPPTRQASLASSTEVPNPLRRSTRNIPLSSPVRRRQSGGRHPYIQRRNALIPGLGGQQRNASPIVLVPQHRQSQNGMSAAPSSGPRTRAPARSNPEILVPESDLDEIPMRETRMVRLRAALTDSTASLADSTASLNESTALVNRLRTRALVHEGKELASQALVTKAHEDVRMVEEMRRKEVEGKRMWMGVATAMGACLCVYLWWCWVNGPEFEYIKQVRARRLGL